MTAPTVWLLLGDKLGDNAQARAISTALPWPVEEKRLVFYKPFRSGKPPFFASLYHVDKRASDALEPPWPDMVITVGRRPAMAALWIKEQSLRRAQRQGGSVSKIVLMGRPKRSLDAFDLVIAPRQYDIPVADNFHALVLPLIDVDRERLAKEAEGWRARLSTMARPLTAVLVGGATWPFSFDARAATQLLAGVAAATEHKGPEGPEGPNGPKGSIYISTSRRTGRDAVRELREKLPAGGQIFEWQPNRGDNPYLALLALADRFVVTGDSVSMLVEVARLGKPLAIFELPRARFGVRSVADALARVTAGGFDRDLTRLHQVLYERGLAVPLGSPERFSKGGAFAENERAAAVRRVMNLLSP